MSRLFEYLVEVRATTREAFAEKYPNAFLVLQQSGDQVASAGGQWSFKTQTISNTSMQAAQVMAKEGVRISPELAHSEVFPVVKSLSNPWPERISVGRARNNDIVLQDNSVSKLHGHFVHSPTGATMLVDAGSRNGIWINSRQLAAGQSIPVAPGDTITFGGTALTYLDAAGLWDLVQQHLQKP